MKKNLNAIIIMLNNRFKKAGSIIRFKTNESKSISIIIEDIYIKSFIINKTYEFYEELETLLYEMGLSEPEYNNDKSTFYCMGKNGELEWE